MAEETPGTAVLRVSAAFPPVTDAEWDAAIQQDLKGADYEKTLVWRPEPGLSIRPYYRRDGLEALQAQTAAAPGEFPFLRPASADWSPVETWVPPLDAIRADEWHDAGATAVQELGFAIAAGVDRLAAATDTGMPAPDAAEDIEFAFAVGTTFFLEIAKLRAARLLWAQACAAFGVDDERARMRMHVRTARINKSRYDVYTNLLRATTEATAAVLGGCGRLTVESFGYAPHLAVNVQRILRDEAHLDAVADPAGGSYYIETLTDMLARDAWGLFQRLEGEGGFAKARQAGTIAAAVDASRAAREAAVASRRRTLVGVNNYPNPGERDAAEVSTRQTGSPRLAEPFERIRDRTGRHARATGRVPQVLLLTRGDVKMRTARANFCLNFFGCAGFDITERDRLEGAPADLIVLCSSDPEYLAFARDVCPQAPVPVLVAGHPVDHIEALRAAGVQGFVHPGSDVVQTLGEWQHRLGMGE